MILKKHYLFFVIFIIIVPCELFSDSLDTIRTYLTQSYHKLLKTIDNQVECENNCKVLERENIEHNNLQLITSFKTSKNNHIDYSLNLRGHIYLPRISKKFELTFSKESNDYAKTKQIEYENETIYTDEKMRIGLRYYFSKTYDFSFYTKLGFKLNSPFGFYQELSIQKNYLHLYNIHTNNKLSLFYFIYHNYFAKAGRIIFYKPFYSSFLLEQRNDININHENHQITHILNYIKLHYTYNKFNILTYRISYVTADKSNKKFFKDWQGMSFSYIHYIRKWFYVDFIPHLVQRKQNQFKTEFILTVNIGLKLGL